MRILLSVSFLLSVLVFVTDAETASATHPFNTAVDDTTEYTVTEAAWTSRVYIGKRDTVSFDSIGEFFSTHLPQIFSQANAKGVEIVGQPTGLYWHWDMENARTIMAAAIPVRAADSAPPGYEILTFPSGTALVVDYFGPYEQSVAAHTTLDAYAADKTMGSPTVVIEEYITDPEFEPDPARWHTRIVHLFAD